MKRKEFIFTTGATLATIPALSGLTPKEQFISLDIKNPLYNKSRITYSVSEFTVLVWLS